MLRLNHILTILLFLYIYIYIYIFTYAYAYAYVHVHMYMYICMCLCTYVRTYINTYICRYRYRCPGGWCPGGWCPGGFGVGGTRTFPSLPVWKYRQKHGPFYFSPPLGENFAFWPSPPHRGGHQPRILPGLFLPNVRGKRKRMTLDRKYTPAVHFPGFRGLLPNVPGKRNPRNQKPEC